MCFEVPHLLNSGFGQGDQLGPSVRGIGAADYQTEVLEFGDVPAKDGRADAKPGRELRGPGLPLADEAQDSLQGEADVPVLPHARGHDASKDPLEIENLMNE